jgi:NADH-quinone oxidoreductase subunit N
MLPRLRSLIVLIALITVLYGNLAALPQNNLKRLLGYSSIAHAGYLLIGVACFNGPAVVFYLVAYLIMTLLSFAIMVPVAGSTGEEISNFDGLGKRAPFLAFGMLLAMASLAGVPFTAGFFGKFAIFASAVAQNQMLLVVAGVLTVACGFYYYLKVVRAMYWQPATSEQPIAVGKLSRAVMIMLMIATIVFGVYPQPIFNAMKSQPASVALKSTSSR